MLQSRSGRQTIALEQPEGTIERIFGKSSFLKDLLREAFCRFHKDKAIAPVIAGIAQAIAAIAQVLYLSIVIASVRCQYR